MINMYKILKNHVKSKCSSLRLNKFQRQAKPLWFSRWLPQPHKSIKWIWRKRNYVKVLCWPPPAGWLLLQPSDGQRKQVIWENLMEEASCQVALLTSSGGLIAAPAIWWTKESKSFDSIICSMSSYSCWPRPARALLLQPSDWQRKQVIWENLMEEASCQVALLASSGGLIAAPAIWWTKESKSLDSIICSMSSYSCWPRPARALLLQQSDWQRKQVIWENLMEEASCQVALLASSGGLIAAPAIWWTKESKSFDSIICSMSSYSCWPRPARALLLQPSDWQRKQVIWENLMEEASCQVALLASSGGLIAAPSIWWTKESKSFDSIICSMSSYSCWPRPARALLLQPSDWQRKQVIWENLMEEASCQVTAAGLVQRGRCCSSHLIDNESRWFERIWWKRHHVKLLCWPRPAQSLLFAPSDGQRKASDLRESHGRGIMSSCSAGLVRHGHCCSRHLMDKGKQVIWENLTEEASCQVALLASSSAIVAAPAVWWTGTMNYTS